MPALRTIRIFNPATHRQADPDTEAVLNQSRTFSTGRAVVTTLLASVLALACGGGAADSIPDDSGSEAGSGHLPSTDAASATDFRVLFDGTSLEAWRGYRSETVPSGWSIDGEHDLAFEPVEGGRGDLITVDQFTSFELVLEWRVAEGGNSGIFFHVTEDHDWPWESGPEMQVLDDARHADGQSPLTSAGSNYALHAPSVDVVNPAGEWNEVRLTVDGAGVEHWLNGVKIVEYTLGSPEWNALVGASKFASMPAYGGARRGHIALQDHGDRVWYRDIRIREIGGGR